MSPKSKTVMADLTDIDTNMGVVLWLLLVFGVGYCCGGSEDWRTT